MTPRERFMNALTFQPVDRVPLVEWEIRGATMARWVSEGYPEGVPSEEYFHLDRYFTGIPIGTSMHPRFEEKVLSIEGDYKIRQDDLGAIRKDFVRMDTPGFVTRTWLKFAVTDRASFMEMTKRYDPHMPGRIPEDFDLHAQRLNAQTEAPTHLCIPHLFWAVRDWVGFENLCTMFYDDPELVADMFNYLTDFFIETIRPAIDRIRVDVVELKEDMAYKGAPMISPAMFKKFMYPGYVKLISFLKSHGARLVYVDCDGYPGNELTALWLDAGVDGVSPCEIAAGNDPIQLRKDFPRLAIFGGIDKRALARDKKTIETEVYSKVPYMLEKGGYVPHIDHAIPHDVPLSNYLYYREVLEKVVKG